RREPRPFRHVGVGTAPAVARLVALEADAAGPEVFGASGGDEIAEAEAVVGERDRTVGIAFAGGDRIAEAGDQQVAHLDRTVRPPGDAAGRRDVDRDRRGGAVAGAQVDVLAAARRERLRRRLAALEGPGAARVGRNLAGEAHGDAMVGRCKIGFAHAVAQAGVEHATGAVDAQASHHVARPAAAVGLLRQRLLGLEDA